MDDSTITPADDGALAITLPNGGRGRWLIAIHDGDYEIADLTQMLAHPHPVDEIIRGNRLARMKQGGVNLIVQVADNRPQAVVSTNGITTIQGGDL